MTVIHDSLKFTQSQLYKLDEPVTLIYACLISRIPALLIGNPGTAKSHTCKLIANQFGQRDTDWFYQSITAKTSPEKLLGGIIAEKMLQGIEEYNLAVGAASKKGVILDELFKSQHPAMMNALLSFCDENPTVFSGGRNLSPEWHWLFATTNFEDLPEDLRFDPLWDRFGAKVIINNMTAKDSRAALLQSISFRNDKKGKDSFALTFDDLTDARIDAAKVELPVATIDFFYDKCLPILEKHCYISQRKINSLFVGKPNNPSILQSLAYLEQDAAISPDNLRWIPYLCWQDPNKFEKLLTEFKGATVLPIITTYKQVQADLERFICEANALPPSAAHEQYVFLFEAVKHTIQAFSAEEKAKVPKKTRQKLEALLKEASEIDKTLYSYEEQEF